MRCIVKPPLSGIVAYAIGVTKMQTIRSGIGFEWDNMPNLEQQNAKVEQRLLRT